MWNKGQSFDFPLILAVFMCGYISREKKIREELREEVKDEIGRWVRKIEMGKWEKQKPNARKRLS